MGEVEKGNGVKTIPVSTDSGEVTFQVEYNYHAHTTKEVTRKFTKITKISLDKWDLTEIVDHNLKELINNRIFNEVNGDIYGK
jgi:predicted component of type VI protein secretion system